MTINKQIYESLFKGTKSGNIEYPKERVSYWMSTYRSRSFNRDSLITSDAAVILAMDVYNELKLINNDEYRQFSDILRRAANRYLEITNPPINVHSSLYESSRPAEDDAAF